MVKPKIDKEQRSVPRWPVAFVGYCYGVQGSTRCFISELGANGLKFVTGLRHKVGEELVTAWIIDDLSLHVTGIVRHVGEDGVGLEFLDISPTARSQILDYLRRRRS